MKKSLLCSTLALAVASAAQAAPKTVDIMVLYTPAATQTANGRDINARIASYIEFANTAYEKSGVNLRLRLVHKQRLDWADYPTVTGANLDRFMRDPQVQRLREQYGADLVSLVNRSQNSGNGYITCGIGYMGSGDKNSGRFHGNAKDIAYNLTGVDCGLNTFAHEAGHNMGLRHSYEQDLESSYYDPRYAHSGTYEWSRGYGMQGRFATVMAYPHAFGTNKQAPFFANPRLVNAECANQPCGREEHADAVRALNSMATQIADFRPTKVPGTLNPGSGGDTPTPPDLPWCTKAKLGGLLGDGEFASMEGWRAWSGNAQLSLVNVAKGCRDNALLVDVRGFDLLVRPIAPLRAGSGYRLSGKVMLKAANTRETVRMALLSERADGALAYNPAQSVELSVSGNEFSRLEKTFDYRPAADQRNLYVAVWSDSGASLLVDEMNLQEAQSAPPSVPPAPKRIAYDFESGIGGWSGVHASTRATRVASAGRLALEAYQRRYAGTGASTSLLGNLEAGRTYAFSADVRVGDGRGSQAMTYAYLYLESQGRPGEYLPLGYKVVENGRWASLRGQVQLPKGPIKRAELMILSGNQQESMFIDNVQLLQK
ncbi:metalloendopeptidase Mep72 [Pseudomonas aeruginosa]|uniref:metalloendopeptidase Mep72 n=1 Tax=Pseudomonas aeruginosa TaxID=287 RepID=UPI00071BBD1E|nr:metalloendopeptidase Mep72 [Pseudomonas aeruginosa]KSB96872.1 carbohydrate-binding protein [Pseudomonas aeruginosa]